MDYILFIHNNADHPATESQWEAFFSAANKSGIFSGGSEIGKSVQFGAKSTTPAISSVVGYMRFQTDDISRLHKLLELHPIYLQGGTLELCETPKT